MKLFFEMRMALIVGMILLCLSSVQGQSFQDNALLFGRTQLSGSARMQAMGGSHVALGGDYSSALANPAGLGMYNRSEVTFSLGYSGTKSNIGFLGNRTTENDSRLTVPGFSFVLNLPKEDGSFLGGSFAVSFTRINDLNLDYIYRGRNTKSSIIDYFLEDAEGRTPEGLGDGQDFYSLTGLAYNNYLIDFDGQEPISALGNFSAVDQYEHVQRKGSQYQWSIAYGANFSDKFFLGASLGITSLKFKSTINYSESAFGYTDPSYTPLDSFEFGETIDISGTGYNLNLGFIYRPVDFLQLGASFTTPTFYRLTDSYNASMDSYWNDFDYFEDGETILNDEYAYFDSPLLSEYNLSTPLKLNLGASYINKFGLLTAGIEFINYGKTKYRGLEGESFEFENNDIKGLYTSVINYKVGGEFRHDIFRMRAGYNLMTDPFKDSYIDQKAQSFTGGVGMRKSKFFADLGVVYSQWKTERIPYVTENLPYPVADLKFTNTNFILTFGFTF